MSPAQILAVQEIAIPPLLEETPEIIETSEMTRVGDRLTLKHDLC